MSTSVEKLVKSLEDRAYSKWDPTGSQQVETRIYTDCRTFYPVRLAQNGNLFISNDPVEIRDIGLVRNLCSLYRYITNHLLEERQAKEKARQQALIQHVLDGLEHESQE